jgi:hypothetical protein
MSETDSIIVRGYKLFIIPWRDNSLNRHTLIHQCLKNFPATLPPVDCLKNLKIEEKT